MTERLTAPPGAAGERLDVYLAKTLGRPRNQVARLLKQDLVRVNGQPGRASYQIQPGDVVEHTDPPAAPGPASAPDLPVVYEDADLIVIDKPTGLTVHPGAATGPGPTVADFARTRTSDDDAERPGIVHRLDRDTSGLLIIAKTAPAKAYLQRQFQARQVHKTYQLLTVGHPSPDAAIIKLPVGRNPKAPLQQAVILGGRPAETAYTVTQVFPGYALVEAKPLTGRTHQLRVHFAAIGHPVAGDTTYGAPRRQLGLTRQFLHAAALEFTAPSGQTLALTSPLPADLQAVLTKLEATL